MGVNHTNVCVNCNIKFNSKLELEWHIETEHEPVICTAPANKVKCRKCSFEADDLSAVDEHMEAQHGKNEVTSSATTATIQCSMCDYNCKLNIQLNKHMKKKHKPEDCKYQCNFCEFQTDVIIRMYEHRLSDHPEVPVGFTPKNVSGKDYVLNFLA